MPEDVNWSETAREVRTRELAALDWANTPSTVIKEKFGGITPQTLAAWRDTDSYKETVEELRAEWMKEMLRLPSTSDLKKKISHGMVLSVQVLIDCLTAPKTAWKDKIGAARLMSQLDGRFLRETSDGDDPGRQNDTVADELLRHITKPRVM